MSVHSIHSVRVEDMGCPCEFDRKVPILARTGISQHGGSVKVANF